MSYHLFLKLFGSLALVCNDAVPPDLENTSNDDEEEEDVEEHDAKEGEVEEQDNPGQGLSRTDEASLLLTHLWVEEVVPGGLSKIASVPREEGVEGSDYAGEKKWDPKAKRGGDSHARVVRVDGGGVVPGERPDQIEAKCGNPEKSREQGRESRPVRRIYLVGPREVQEVLYEQEKKNHRQET